MHNQNKEGVDLDKLEALARAAEKNGQHIYTHPRDSNKWQDNANWQGAASPEAFLTLIALARRAEPSVAAADVRALGALAAITNRLGLTYNLCCGLAPKQAVGELLEVTINMPEWEIVRAALASPAVSQKDGVAVAWIATDLDGRAGVGFTKEEAKRLAGEGCTEFIPLFDLGDAATTASASDLTMSMFATRQDFDDAIKGTAHTCGLAGEHFGVCPHCRAQAPSREAAAKASDARYSQGYEDGWREGRFDLANSGASHAANAGEEFAQYLKDGETPIQRLKREIQDSEAATRLLAKERARFEFLHGTNVDADGWEWGVARVRVDQTGKVEFLWGCSDHSDLDAAIASSAEQEAK